MRHALIATLVAATLAAIAHAEEPANDACALLTAEEVTALLGQAADPRPESGQKGLRGCQWVEKKTYSSFTFTLRSGEALGGQTADEYFDAYRGLLLGSREDVAALGDAAAMADEGALIRMIVRIGDTIMEVTAPGLTKEKTIGAARLVTTRL